MEIPYLSISSIGCLQDHVSVVDEIKVSAIWEFGDDVEVSFDIKSESFIEFSFSWFTLPFIDVDNVPLLVDSSMLWMDDDVSVFLVNTTSNVSYLTLLIGEESTVHSEHLPPS